MKDHDKELEDSEEFERIARFHDPDEDRINHFMEELHNIHESKTPVLSERPNNTKFEISCGRWSYDIMKQNRENLPTFVALILKFQRFLTAEHANHIRYNFPERDVEEYNAEHYINLDVLKYGGHTTCKEKNL